MQDDAARARRRVAQLPRLVADQPAGWTEPNLGVGGCFRGAIDHARHVAQIHQLAMMHRDHRVGDIFRVAQEWATVHHVFAIIAIEATHAQIGVGALERVRHFERRHLMAGQPFGIQLDPDFARTSAHYKGMAGVGNLLHAMQNFVGHAPQLRVIRVRAVEGDRQDRNVIDTHRLDDPSGHPGRHRVAVRFELVVNLDGALDAIGANLEAHRHHRHAGPRDRIDVPHPVHLPELFLEVDSDEVFHLARAGPRHLYDNVGHGDDDLRVLLARGGKQGDSSGRKRSQQQEQ